MRPIRFFQAGQLYFVTNRTIQSRLLMRPSPLINQTIGAIVCRGLQRYPVKLYAFVFTSNHFHLILSGRSIHIARFMAHLQSNIARRVGALVDWRGKFWARRYSAEPILDDDALVGRLQYIFEHGTKEGLVSRAQKWPGLTSIPELVHGTQRNFHWFHSARYQIASQSRVEVKRKDFTEELPLTLHPLPCWETLSKERRLQRARKTLEAANHNARAHRGNKPPLGRAKVLEQHPHTRPKATKRSNRPMCHSSCPMLRKQFKQAYKAFLQAYWEASKLFAAGTLSTEFPPGTFRPGLAPET